MGWKKTLHTNHAQVLFVCAAFALMVIIGGFFVGDILRTESLKTVEVALDESEKTIRAYLREPVIAFDNIYTAVADMLDKDESQEAIQRYLEQTSAMLAEQDRGITGFQDVYGFIRDEMVTGTDVDLGDDYIPQQRPWYQLAIRNYNSQYTAPYIDADTGRVVVSLSREIYGASGDYYGVLAMDINILWLMEYAESLQFADGGYGMIVNQYLYILAHPKSEFVNIPIQQLGAGYERIATMLRTNQEVSAQEIKDYDSTRSIIFFKALYNGWRIGVVMPTNSYYSELYRAILLLVILGGILAFILSYILLRLSGAKELADEKSKAKSSFLASMSHEMRTPMNAIIGISQIQLQKGGLSDESADAFEKIYSSGSSLLGIINDILDLSKIETGKMEIVPAEYDTPSLINDAVRLNTVRIGSKPIEFLLDADKNLPAKLYGDELRLKQILNNLLSNAIKYTEKGYVKLSVSHTHQGEDVDLCFSVEDTGQGLLPEDKDRLFSEFERFNTEANLATEGTGIGLSITKRLVGMMDGSIEVESEYGKGSVFTVTVKQKAMKCGAIGEELAKQLQSFNFKSERRLAKLQISHEPMPYGKVLLVDDVETNLYVAEGLLAPYKLKIETAVSGFAALDKIKSGQCYDIIFMDHMMPLMDGIETTKKIRGLGYKAAVIALTANALSGSDKLFMENGFDGFVSKPIDIYELNAVLNEFVRDKYPEEAEKYKSETTARAAAVQPEGLNPKLLEIFRRDAQNAISTLRESVAGGSIKLFTTTVHAMKSALANIGENEKSEAAAALEDAGIKGDTVFISANTGAFIESLDNLIKSIIPAESAIDADGEPDEDIVYLIEQLRVIELACDDYDDTAAYTALDLLKEKGWRKETAAALENIRDMLFLHSDFEGAAEQAIALSESLSL